MEKQPLDRLFEKVVKELRKDVEEAISQLQVGMQEYLSNNVSISQLLKMVEKLGLSNMIDIAKTPISGLDYYKILGLEKTASNAEITERYREIIRKIHPDVAGKEMTFLASLINTAYEMILKERGIK